MTGTALLVISLFSSIAFLGVSIYLSTLGDYIPALFSFIAGIILLSCFLSLFRELRLKESSSNQS